MSRFTCTVNVLCEGQCKIEILRNGAIPHTILGTECDSSSLVPGDVVNLVEPQLSTLPADMFLLSGDAIVNESMLTGESVPVGKVPVKDEDLSRFKDSKDITGDMAKSFLYAGTRVVRMRGSPGTDGSSRTPALGLVVRTGESRSSMGSTRYAQLTASR